jgi:hypothetical protein
VKVQTASGFFPVRKKELPHLKHIRPREPATKSHGQVLCQPGYEFFAVRSSIRTLLFLLHDAPTDLPVRCGHDGIHRPPCRLSGAFQHL